MTKKEFIKAIANKMEVSVKKADQFFDAFVFVLKEELIAENKVQLLSLGIFETRIRRGRDTINPFTMNELSVPEKRVIKFTPSKYLRELVNF